MIGLSPLLQSVARVSLLAASILLNACGGVVEAVAILQARSVTIPRSQLSLEITLILETVLRN